ncbi:hypothetical protein [Gimesia chilikensis]|uniref:hypothetical protein n=1 Tax=Gimesia chilikensis TaxID=2605989 RepID=UPI003A928B68
MADTKIRSLLVRPIRSVDLAFNMPGVIAFQNTQTAKLGTRITGTNLETSIYELMEQDAKTARSKNLPELTFDATEIASKLSAGTLFAIRNKSLCVALDQKLLQRENIFREQYKHQAKLIKKLKDMYKGGAAVPPDSATGSNPKTKQQRLGTLIAASQDKFTALKKAYGKAGVQGTSSTDVTYNGRIVTKSKTLGSGVQIQGHQTHVHEDNPPSNPKQILVHHTNAGTPIGYNAKDKKWEDITEEGYRSSEHSLQYLDITEKNEGNEKGFKQTSTTKHREFVYPRRDALIRFLRTQIDLMDEQLAEEMYGHLVNDDLDKVMKNELELIDNEVLKLQLNLAHTFLTSPVGGLVTAIYKDLGESVSAGDPVLRVEDDSTVLLVGRLRHPGPIRVGATAVIETTSLFENNKIQKFSDAKVVSVRGHAVDNDEWELMLEVENPLVDPSHEEKGRILPLNYHFDRDNTTIEITNL